MSYLLDKKLKQKKFSKIALGVLILFLVIYFHTSVFRGLSVFSHTLFRPVLVLGNNIKDGFANIGSTFRSKKFLTKENENLKLQLTGKDATLANYNSLLDENSKLKEILSRKSEKSNMVLSAILSKPNRSPYDTLLIDAGAGEGVATNDKVFALGDVPIGYVAEVYTHSAKIILFSNPGEKTEVVVSLSSNTVLNTPDTPPGEIVDTAFTPAPPARSGKDVFMQLVGRGGGNFEMILPRDLSISKDTEVHLPGITPYTIATVETIISDPRDAFTKALLVAPVNVEELKFVEIQK